MRFFTYSPLDMTETEAYKLALPHLDPSVIVHVTRYSCTVEKAKAGARPQALPNTYLVRVEQDQSLRVVQKDLG
jgi:hypothetical protein